MEIVTHDSVDLFNYFALFLYHLSLGPEYTHHVQVDVTLKPRWGHTLTASSLGTGLTVTTVFGGIDRPWSGDDNKQHKVADTTLLHFRKCIYIRRYRYCKIAEINLCGE